MKSVIYNKYLKLTSLKHELSAVDDIGILVKLKRERGVECECCKAHEAKEIAYIWKVEDGVQKLEGLKLVCENCYYASFLMFIEDKEQEKEYVRYLSEVSNVSQKSIKEEISNDEKIKIKEIDLSYILNNFKLNKKSVNNLKLITKNKN